MVDITARELAIEIGGAPVALHFDFNALARWEGVTGRSALAAETWERVTATDLRALVWAMAAQDGESPTLEEVGRALTPDRLEEVLHLVDQVLGAQLLSRVASGNGAASSTPAGEA